MEVQFECFNEFPDQCAGCPDYTEVQHDHSAEFAWLAGMNSFIAGKTVKECKRYHKRKVEYMR